MMNLPLSPTDPLASGVANFGTGLVILMMLAQVPLYYTAIRAQTLHLITYVPLVGMIFNFSAWTVYGIAQADPNILNVNIAGAAIAACYMALQLVFNTGAQRLAVARGLALGCGAAVGIEAVLFFAVPGGARKTALGAFGVTCNVIMFAGPIVALKKAVTDLDASALPVLLIIAYNLCSITWGAYGYLVYNWFVCSPNVIVSSAAGETALVALQSTQEWVTLMLLRRLSGSPFSDPFSTPPSPHTSSLLQGTVINLAQLIGVIYIYANKKPEASKDDTEAALISESGDVDDGLIQ